MSGLWLYESGLASVLFADVTPSPTPSPGDVLRPGLSEWDVTPGLAGFVAMFLVVLAAVAVWFSMNKKLRKLQFDERRMNSAAAARSADSAQELSDASAAREVDGAHRVADVPLAGTSEPAGAGAGAGAGSDSGSASGAETPTDDDDSTPSGPSV